MVQRAKQARGRRIEFQLALAAAVLILLVWIVSGIRAKADLIPSLRQAEPRAHHFQPQGDGLFAAYGDAGSTALLGFVAIGTASGYGGPLELAVAVDPTGQITGLTIVNHRETPVWFSRVLRTRLPASLIGKGPQDAFTLGQDLDGVTGATHTSRALGAAALDGSRKGARALGIPVLDTPRVPLRLGLPEWVVVALFATGLLAHRSNSRLKNHARWASMITGLLVLGFITNLPLTLGFFSRLILGYWPAWQSHMYWYLLVGGILFIVLLNGKNPYCEWFCPFGAAQECMGAIGGAKVRTPRRHRTWLKWLQRGLALGALLLGVFYRNPGLGSYELFGTLFGFVGSGLQFVALGLVLLAALYMRRPWCSYLCPVRPVTDWMRVIREGLLRGWNPWIQSRRAP